MDKNILGSKSNLVNRKVPKKARKHATPPTITVRMRVYRDDSERLEKLRQYAATLTPASAAKGVAL